MFAAEMLLTSESQRFLKANPEIAASLELEHRELPIISTDFASNKYPKLSIESVSIPVPFDATYADRDEGVIAFSENDDRKQLVLYSSEKSLFNDLDEVLNEFEVTLEMDRQEICAFLIKASETGACNNIRSLYEALYGLNIGNLSTFSRADQAVLTKLLMLRASMQQGASYVHVYRDHAITAYFIPITGGYSGSLFVGDDLVHSVLFSNISEEELSYISRNIAVSE